MSLSAALLTANSGLLAAQTGLRAVSDNIANVNTPGYVRKTVDQRPLVVDGRGMGVEVTGVKRVTDQYLQMASLTAASDASRWDMVSQYLDNAQGLFGNPSDESFFFSGLDEVWQAFAAAANDPSSSLTRSQAISNVEDFLSEAGRINSQINQLTHTVDAQVSASVARANELLVGINNLNVDITRAKLIGTDASGSENMQSQLLDELSSIMNVRVAERSGGGVTVRSTEGMMLAGDGAATLTYSRSDTTRGYILAAPAGGGLPQGIEVTGGEIRGLLDLRDERLPSLSNQLGEFMTRTTEAINAAHNASSAVPAPAELTGRDTGMDQLSALAGFSGVSTVAIVNAQGVVQRRVAIDFTNSTFSINGGAAAAFNPATFAADLDAALGAFGHASFNGGQLTVGADGVGNGIAIDKGTSDNAGKGFSHFFGLNDLVRSASITSYETGLAGGDAHQFTGTGSITLRLAQPDGKPLRDVTITPTAGGDMNSLLASLNNAATGVGLYGQFTLDARGAVSFVPSAPANANVSVVSDNTTRGTNGPSISEFFGIGVAARSTRANQFSVNPRFVSDPSQLALAQLDLTVPALTSALRPGDGRGATAIATAGDVTMGFMAAGGLGAVSMSVTRYAQEFGGSIGRDAAAAETRKKSAEAVQNEATARRQSVEGVNIDEELVRLTTYQQAFNASARMIQAAKEMFDVLSNLI